MNTFLNEYGEKWVLSIDPGTMSGWLAGDETGWEKLEIKDNRLAADFFLATEEAAWLRTSWKAATGQDLDLPATRIMEAYRAGHPGRFRTLCAELLPTLTPTG